MVDNHRLLVHGQRRALAATEDFEVVGEAMDAEEGLLLVHELQPDLVLLDLRMPKADVLACLERLGERAPQASVVVLSSESDDEYVGATFARGAAAFLADSIAPDHLAQALRHAIGMTLSRLSA